MTTISQECTENSIIDNINIRLCRGWGPPELSEFPNSAICFELFSSPRYQKKKKKKKKTRSASYTFCSAHKGGFDSTHVLIIWIPSCDRASICVKQSLVELVGK